MEIGHCNCLFPFFPFEPESPYQMQFSEIAEPDGAGPWIFLPFTAFRSKG